MPRTLRIAVDLQACQTENSAQRGVGRFSQALFEGIRQNAAEADVRVVASDELRHALALEGFPRTHVTRVRGLPRWNLPPAEGPLQDALDGMAYDALLAPLDADVVHVSNVFEGLAERVPLPGPARAPGQVVSATMHDLIPLIYQDHYLREPHVRSWYFRKLGWVRQADLLLCNSEATRQDVIALLGMQPHQVVTVHGGVAGMFQPSPQGPDAALKRKYGIRRRYVLYTGGDDFRKNVRGAIAGFAALPGSLRADCQIVVVCAMSEESRQGHLRFAREQGLAPSALLLLGFVPDADLVGLYQSCDAFVFPSLYEGLGLPVLEAMACGAPVVGANNSSIRELIERQDALFDGANPASVAAALARVLSDPAFEASLRRWGPQRAAQFTWAEAGRRSVEAFVEAQARCAGAGVGAAAGGWLPRARLAMLTPLPPAKSGIADYNAQFLPFLAKHFDIDLFVDREVDDVALRASFRILPVDRFEALADRYDVILYEFGNSEFHAHMVELLERHPGVVGLHDGYLSGMMGWRDFHGGHRGDYARDMLAAHGPLARRFLAPAQRDPEPVGNAMAALPAYRRVLQAATGVISHTPFNLALVRQFDPQGLAAPHRVIPQMFPVPPVPADGQAGARAALGLPGDAIVIATYGHVVWTKAGDQLVRAFEQSAAAADPRVHLVFAGELEPNAYAQALQEQIAASPLAARIRITGRLAAADYEHWLWAADVAIQLRFATRGGTSRAVLDCLAHGLPVVVNDDASFRDYPDDVVAKVPAQPTVAQIAAGLDRLVADPALRRRFAEAGRAHVQAHHDPAACAAHYAAALHEFSRRWRRRQPAFHAERMAPLLAACPDPAGATQQALDWLEALVPPAFGRQRILLDVSEVLHGPLGGLREPLGGLVQALYCSGRHGHEPIAVHGLAEDVHLAHGWLASLGLLTNAETQDPRPTAVQAGGTDLWLAFTSARPEEDTLRRLADARLAGALTVTVLLQPLPAAVRGLPFPETIARCDLVLVATAEDAARVAAATAALPQPPRTACWQAGGDAAAGAAALLDLLLGGAPAPPAAAAAALAEPALQP